MKKDGWVISLAVIGIALLAAAVALMPACDTGGGIDACEELAGSWTVTYTPVDNTCPWTAKTGSERVDFEVSGGQVSMDLYEGESLETSRDGTISCDGKEFSISWTSDPADVGPGCYLTASMAIDGSFDGSDEFTGTWVFSEDYDGACIPGIQDDCVEAYDISAVRR